MQSMPEFVREAVRKKGLRNVTLLTVAPTGTTGTMVNTWATLAAGYSADQTTVPDRALVIGDRCVIGAGALLLADADAEGVYIGTATERAKVPSTKLRRI
mgnify:CR=1 FL=1